MFRNKEFRVFSVLFCSFTVVIAAVGFIVDLAAGIFAVISSVIFGVMFFVFTKARYERIAQISSQIDLVLHNVDYLDFKEVDEGELSILYSEITKMTLRIREQNEALKNEKKYLADSLADIAHQLRTPLTSANLIISFLAKNPDEDEQKAFVRELEGLLVNMDWLITSLLKLSRVDAGVVEFQEEEFLVSELIEHSLQPLAISMELHNVNLKIDIPQGAVIKGDLGWIAQGVENILKNCMENAGENGEIEISCDDNALHTQIIIHDSGAGVAKEDLPFLFDRFYRGKNTNSTGYGIGLALCKMIITRNGGYIRAKNHPKGGAMFILCFPKVTDVSPRSHREVI